MHRWLSSLMLIAAQATACDTRSECSDLVPSIETDLVTPSPEQYLDMSGCSPRTFDLTSAINLEDDGTLTIAWLLAHSPGSGEPPEQINRLQLTVDPCTNGKLVAGRVTTLEAIVLRANVPLVTLSNSDELKKLAKAEGPGSNVIWFFGFDTTACCSE